MKIRMSKETTMAAVSTTIVAISITWAILTVGTNASLRDLLDDSRLNSEKLLSEKLAMEKKVHKTSEQLDQIKGLNTELDKTIVALKSDLSQKETMLKNMAFKNKKLQALEKDYDKIQKINKDLDASVAGLHAQIQSLENEMRLLNTENKQLSQALANLEKENATLKSNLTLAHSMSADNYLIETTKGKKEKLTIRAKKTDKIELNFAVPESLNSNLKFTITAPSGKVYSSENDKGFSMDAIPSTDMYASLAFTGSGVEQIVIMSMQYKPEYKLTPGIYEIDVYSNKMHIGVCRIRLD